MLCFRSYRLNDYSFFVQMNAIIRTISQKIDIIVSFRNNTILSESIMSYPIPDMEWPSVSKTQNPVLLSERYGTTGRCWDIPVDSHAANEIQKLLASYKVPVYHIAIDEITEIGYMPGYKEPIPYVYMRYIYVWTFSGPKTPVVHIYIQEGNQDHPTCHFEKTIDATLLTDPQFECEEILKRMQEL